MLRGKVSVQQGHVAALQAENSKLRRDHATLQAEFDDYRRSRSLRGAAVHAGDEAATQHVDVSAGEAAAPNRLSIATREAEEWIAAAEAEAVADAVARSRDGSLASSLAGSAASSTVASPTRPVGSPTRSAASPRRWASRPRPELSRAERWRGKESILLMR